MAVLVAMVTALFGLAHAQNLEVRPDPLFENSPPHTYVENVAHALEDKLPTGLRWEVMDRAAHARYFTLSARGELRTSDVTLDREAVCPGAQVCELVLNLAARGAAVSFVKVHIRVTDLNDDTPTFTPARVHVTLREDARPGYSVRLPRARDLDSPRYALSRYELVDGHQLFTLKVTGDDLRLQLDGDLDREKQEQYQLQVRAFDRGTPPKVGQLQVNVTVRDVNDNRPAFARAQYEATVPEDFPLARSILTVRALDRDAGAHGQVLYSLSEDSRGRYGNLFHVNNRTGTISLLRSLDYETQHSYTLVVTAQDNTPSAVAVETRVVVKVTDVNDSPPRIVVDALGAAGAAGEVRLAEPAAPGTIVCLISVRDQDSQQNGQFTCHLDNADFAVEAVTSSDYRVTTRVTLDREAHARHRLPFICEDLGTPRLTASAVISLVVMDTNDNAPRCEKDVTSAVLEENTPPGALVTTLNCSDPDLGDNGAVVYVLPAQAQTHFRVDQRTGAVYTTSSLDYEQQREIRYDVTVRDKGTPQPRVTMVTVILRLLDVNDEAPRFTARQGALQVYENEAAGSEVGQLTAVDADNTPYNLFRFRQLPVTSRDQAFRVDAQSGKVFTSRSLDRETQARQLLKVTVYDLDRPVLSSTATFTVKVKDRNDHDPEVTFPNNLNNTVHISPRSPAGHHVTTLRARDRDEGDNARLTFTLAAEGDAADYFSVDSVTGAVRVRAALTQFTQRVFPLTLVVRDAGVTSRSTQAVLNVAVSSAVPYDALTLSTPNLVTVIAVVVVSVVVALALVVAIVILRRQERRHAQKRLLSHLLVEKRDVTSGGGARTLQALVQHEDKFSNSSRDQSFTSSQQGSGRRAGAEPRRTGNSGKKEVSFSDDTGSDVTPGVSERASLPRWAGDTARSLSGGEGAGRQTGSQAFTQHNPNYEYQVQQAFVVPTLQEKDSLSTGSAESGSATDSGRGSHEEDSPTRPVTSQHGIYPGVTLPPPPLRSSLRSTSHRPRDLYPILELSQAHVSPHMTSSLPRAGADHRLHGHQRPSYHGDGGFPRTTAAVMDLSTSQV